MRTASVPWTCTALALAFLGAPALAGAQPLTGHISEDGSGTPIAGVQVRVTSASGQTLTTVTDALGDYSFVGLSAGTYFVRTANTSGYIDELWDEIPCFNCQVTTGSPVVLSGAAVAVNFELVPGGRIAGTVTSDDPVPLPLDFVTVLIIDKTGSTVSQAVTNAAGAYISGTGLPTGAYFVRLTQNLTGHLNELYDDIPCPAGCSPFFGTSVAVVQGATTPGIDFALTEGGRVSGTVIDANTLTPLQGVNVQIADTLGRVITNSITDATGSYESVSGVPAGQHFARARVTSGVSPAQGYIEEVYDDTPCPLGCPTISGDSFAVSLGATTSGIDFALTEGGSITGVVTDAATSQPLASVGVQIYDASGRLFTSGTTNALGIYISQGGLPSGTYFARTGNGLGYINELYGGAACVPSNCPITSGTPIVVASPGTTSSVDFALTAGGRISGTITSLGVPLRNIFVNAFDTAGFSVGGGATNALGEYLLGVGLPSGSYFVRVSNGQGYVNELYNGIDCLGPCNVLAGTAVVVVTGIETPNIDFDLAPGGQFSGVVTAQGSGAPLSGIGVQVFDGAGVNVAGGGTDALGQYLTGGGLPAGNYFLRTFNNQGLVNEIYDALECTSSCDVTTGSAVGVVAGAVTSGIDFELRVDSDPDADGITDTVDAQPAVFSNDFSDVPLGGTTSGTIASRGGWTLAVMGHPQGVQAIVQGAGSSASLDTCAAGGEERVTLDAAGETAIITCTGTSTFVRAAVANPTIELREPPTGPGTSVLLTSGQAAALGSPVVASETNTETIVVLFVDADGAPYGSLQLDPGESVDVNVDTNGNVEITVLEGVVTVTVGSESETLNEGETAEFETPLPLGLVNEALQLVDDLEADGAFKNHGAGQGTQALLQAVKRDIERGESDKAAQDVAKLIDKAESDYQKGHLSEAGRDALVAALTALLAVL